MHPVSGVLRSRPVNADQNKGYAQWESSLLLVSNPSLAMKIALMQLAADDLELLRSTRLATDRPSMIGRAEDGTVIHIFEWESSEAVRVAEHDRDVQENWARFADLSDFVAIGDLAEAGSPFSGFTAIEP